MRSVFFIPPLRSISGGLAAIYALAETLLLQGHNVAVTCPKEETPGFSALSASIERLDWAELSTGKIALTPHDLFCLPESWPNAMAPAHRAGAKLLVYVQNWSFLLTTLPNGVRWADLPLHYLAVSSPVEWIMQEFLGLHCLSILPPAVNPIFLQNPGEVKPTAKNSIRIGWMPRKNKGLASQIQELCLNYCATHKIALPEFVTLDKLPQPELAATLRTCQIFLSTGFPEGFGLPPLEAMGCGCIPVGFSGLGGFEYMRNPDCFPQLPLFTPAFPLNNAHKPNGLFVADGDVSGAALALGCAIKLIHENNQLWHELRQNALETAQKYTEKSRVEHIKQIWKGFK